MILYNLKNHDGVWLVTYKKKTINADFKDTLHNYDECKIVRVKKGSGIWQINNQDVPFEENDIFVFSRLDFRNIKPSPNTIDIEQVNFLPSSLGSFGGCTDIFFLRNTKFTNKLSDETAKEDINYLFKKLQDYAKEKDTVFKDEIILCTIINMALCVARSFLTEKKPSSFKGDPFTTAAMKYASENLGSDLTLTSAAAHFGFSPTYFSQKFKKSAGISFSDYVATRRINNIILELNKTNSNIIDIAFKNGFRSSSGFYKTFLRITGTSPKSFKTH